MDMMARGFRGSVALGAGVMLWQALGASEAALGRYLLVASEGLYVVEPDGRPSWSYHPAPPGQQVRAMEDDIIYDGSAVPGGHFVFSTHRYIREIDRAKRTVWEYRVTAPVEVKSGVRLAEGRIAVLNSQEQAILELDPVTGKVFRRTPVAAKGTDHTRYMLMRRTPEGNYLVALRAEQRFVEVTPEGRVVHDYQASNLPVLAQRLADGSTLCTGRFGLVKLDADWRPIWSYAPADAAAHFPLLLGWGVMELPDHLLVVANSDWHLEKRDENRVQFFAIDPTDRRVAWMLSATVFQDWKRSETEPRTGLVEHRSVLVQPLR
jgi:hypothetical protein